MYITLVKQLLFLMCVVLYILLIFRDCITYSTIVDYFLNYLIGYNFKHKAQD